MRGSREVAEYLVDLILGELLALDGLREESSVCLRAVERDCERS
jgi:hypothetical protein